MWKIIRASVRGTSHACLDVPCQDASFAAEFRTDSEEGIILVCSDGAGSAAHSHLGATKTCNLVTELALKTLVDAGNAAALGRETVCEWLRAIREAIALEAESLDAQASDLACTLVAAIVDSSSAAFIQIGDGAIVIWDGREYSPVFWPQSGEYANTTNFVTSSDAERWLDFEIRCERIDELSLFTDGIERLALSFPERRAHTPFFRPMFEILRKEDDVDGLRIALRSYLDSDIVSARTDDDKTLMVAIRGHTNDTAVL